MDVHDGEMIYVAVSPVALVGGIIGDLLPTFPVINTNMIRDARVFQVDGCIITKGEQEFSSLLQVRHVTTTILNSHCFLTLFLCV